MTHIGIVKSGRKSICHKTECDRYMIRIDTSLDTHDRRTNENNGYLDIRSKSELSNKDINDFIKTEFAIFRNSKMLCFLEKFFPSC